MRKKLLILAEAGREIGMGHVVRIGHLAKLFKARGHHLDILTNDRGHHYFRSLGISSLDVKNEAVVMQSDITIVDHMLTDNKYLQALRPHTDKLVVIVGAGHTITPETRWIADLIIYQCPIHGDLYSIVPGENIISGYHHLILDPRFAQLELDLDRPFDFLAYFGGGIRDTFATSIVEGLETAGFTVNWQKQPGTMWNTDLYTSLAATHSFVGTMGMVTYEALYTETKPIVFCRSDDHMDIANQLADKFLVENLGLAPQRASNVDKYLDIIIAAHLAPRTIRPPGLDGKGAYRVAREILND